MRKESYLRKKYNIYDVRVISSTFKINCISAGFDHAIVDKFGYGLEWWITVG